MGVGWVHDKNASEVSEPSTDERTGITHPAPTLFLPFRQHPNSTDFNLIQSNST
jgi:hypothetical protein